MAKSCRTQIKQFNGIDYDEIYPKCKNLMSPEIIIIPDEGDEAEGTVTNLETEEVYSGRANHDRTLTFEVNKFGNYHISVRSMAQNSIEEDIVISECKQYKVTFFPQSDPILNNNSWEVIRAYSDAGKAESTWAVGDAKQITINGRVGIEFYSNYQPWVYILGFNHNAELEGNNKIHFGCFRSAQNYSTSNSIALDDREYGSNQDSDGYFHMNRSWNNSGGWERSDMRTELLDADASSPSSAVSDSFLAVLPDDLKTVLKQCTKYTDNTGDQSNTKSDVTSTNDWVWLLSAYEIVGSAYNANSYEENYQKQYDYYKNGNSKIKYKQTNISLSLTWWLRSPAAYSRYSYCHVNRAGDVDYGNYSHASSGLSPAFCV